MNFENEGVYIVVGIIAIVVIIALWLAKTVGIKVDKTSLNLFASKKDTVVVEDIKKSEVDIQNRDNQDVSVKKVSEDSNVKIR